MKKNILGIFIATLLIATAIPVMGEIPIFKYEINTVSKNFEHSQQGSGVVFTDKIIYKKGESVHITLSNNGPDNIDFGGPPIFQIYRFTMIFLAPAWGYIYPDEVGLVLYWLEPGQSRTAIWDQKTSDGDQVFRGIYRVDITYFDHSTNSQETGSDYFLIF